MPDPTWSGYEALARDARINLVDISTNSENNFVPTKQSIEAAIEKAGRMYPDGEVKLMIINTPHNPTGTVYDEKDITDILAALKENHIKGLVDYTYRSIKVPKVQASRLSIRLLKNYRKGWSSFKRIYGQLNCYANFR